MDFGLETGVFEVRLLREIGGLFLEALSRVPSSGLRFCLSFFNLFYTAAFAVLGAFGGAGAAWLVVGALANLMPKEPGDALIAGSISRLVMGAVLGFVLGLALGLYLFKARGDAAQAAVEKKYGFGKIYSGVPAFFLSLCMTLLFPWWHQLERKFGIAAVPCLYYGICAIVLVLSLIVRPRIPRRLIVPLGLLGWMLTFIIGGWVGWHLNHRP